jgi:hypothetical protein
LPAADNWHPPHADWSAPAARSSQTFLCLASRRTRGPPQRATRSARVRPRSRVLPRAAAPKRRAGAAASTAPASTQLVEREPPHADSQLLHRVVGHNGRRRHAPFRGARARGTVIRLLPRFDPVPTDRRSPPPSLGAAPQTSPPPTLRQRSSPGTLLQRAVAPPPLIQASSELSNGASRHRHHSAAVAAVWYRKQPWAT